jgi:hypothetical protein
MVRKNYIIFLQTVLAFREIKDLFIPFSRGYKIVLYRVLLCVYMSDLNTFLWKEINKYAQSNIDFSYLRRSIYELCKTNLHCLLPDVWCTDVREKKGDSVTTISKIKHDFLIHTVVV